MTNALDGNAIAGMLQTVFGGDMTASSGVCASCGTRSVLAELEVYLDVPSVVGRCRHCGNVLLVILHRNGIACVDISGFAELGQPALR
ncbi:MAG TPA: DUF6510 family protein [Pseudonocardiaceae bacterium]|nr:DUF6510 family protein [Pseudonocardiaceae bacterium]